MKPEAQSKKRHLKKLIFFALTGVLSSVAHGQTISAATGQITGIGNSQVVSLPDEASVSNTGIYWNGGGPYTDNAYAIATGDGYSSFYGVSANSFSPLVASVAETNDPGGVLNNNLTATVYLNYDIQINGPAMANIPFRVTADLYAGYTPAANSGYGLTYQEQQNAVFQVYDETQRTYLIDTSAITDPSLSSQETVLNSTVDVNAGDLLIVSETVTTEPLYDASATAFIQDTSFNIDPSFSSAGDYTVNTTIPQHAGMSCRASDLQG